jgi:transcriptional regulator with XRE-family HTH domain
MRTNPCKAIREATGVSSYQFADEAQMARSVVQETELGLYPDVSKHYSRRLGKLAYDYGIDAQKFIGDFPTLNDSYHNWQSECRLGIRGMIATPDEINEDLSPAENFRGDYSIKGWCSLLLIPRSPWTRYETGAQLTMPASIENALSEVEYPYIKELKDAQREWVMDRG